MIYRSYWKTLKKIMEDKLKDLNEKEVPRETYSGWQNEEQTETIKELLTIMENLETYGHVK